jgi:hypothetical protein
MTMEKLRSMGIVVATVVFLGTVGPGFVARSQSRGESQDPTEIARVQQATAQPRQRQPGEPVRPPGGEFPDEATAADIDSLRINAEMLEMDVAAIKSAMARARNQLEATNFPPLGPRGQELQDKKAYEERRFRLEDRLAALTKDYRHKRLELAHLKREIARKSRPAQQLPPEAAGLQETNQRLMSLETKVDQILEALSKIPR